MWIPSDTSEIEAAITAGTLEETATFDGKLALPATSKQNSSLAVDVAAMSTAGGTLLYGVGEDADDRLTVRAPSELAGAAERVAQIVQTSISEVPHIEFKRYQLPEDPTCWLWCRRRHARHTRSSSAMTVGFTDAARRPTGA